jgi:hypothetical protein
MNKFEVLEVRAAAKPAHTDRKLDDRYWQAWGCVKWLKSQGFKLREVSVDARRARIDIEHSSLCDKLEGAVYMTERAVNHPTKRYWLAIRFECQICWSAQELH